VSISPVISKVLEHCILDRYEFLFETCDNQFGFKKRLGCRDAVYTFRCVVDYYVSCGSTVNVGALDLSKAFDKMNHHGLFIKLMERRIPDNLLRFLENWFSLGVTCVKWESFMSDFFVLSSSIRQGGVLSPYLFVVYIDSVIMKVAASNVGCHIKWICINILIYADDILLLAPSISALKELIHVCQNELEWLDMTINVKKSVCMRIGARCEVDCVNIVTNNGHELQWAKSIRYLGAYIVAAKVFTCSLDNDKRSFYRAFNLLFGKIGRIASEDVTVQLLKTK